MKCVYLAGPITGYRFGVCTDWRKEFIRRTPESIECLSPMRGKEECFAGDELIDHRNYNDTVLATQEGILCRDFFDCRRADVVVVNLKGATHVSIGTVMEIAWCHAERTPMVFIMDKEGCPHDHPMIRAARAFRVDTLDEAIHLVRIMLDVPYTINMKPLEQTTR